MPWTLCINNQFSACRITQVTSLQSLKKNILANSVFIKLQFSESKLISRNSVYKTSTEARPKSDNVFGVHSLIDLFVIDSPKFQKSTLL